MSRPLILVALLVPACSLHMRFDGGDESTHREELNITDPVGHVSIDVGSGRVEVTGGDGSQVNVVANVQGSKNKLRHELREGRLALSVDCVESPCGVDVEARVPAATELAAKTGSGRIALRGVRASARLETGSGQITGHDLGGPELNARSGSGDVELDVVTPPANVRVHTGSGDVKVRVPAGAYRVDVSTGSGKERVRGISAESAAARSIAIDTGSGDVAIDAT